MLCAEQGWRLEAAGLPRGFQPQSHLFSSIGEPGLEAAEEILKPMLVGNIGLHVWSPCVFPHWKQLTSAWPPLTETNNEAASELRTSYLWLLSPGTVWLLRCSPTNLSAVIAAI